MNRNLMALFNGYTNYEVDPPEGDKPTVLYAGNTPLDQVADARDLVSALVGKGYTSLKDTEARSKFQLLSNTIGAPLAQKIADSVLIYNQRPEVTNYTPEQRVSNYYSIGSSDKDVANYLQKIKSFGSGVLSGFNDSVLMDNRIMTGRDKLATPTEDTDTAKRIKDIASKITTSKK